MHGPEQFRETHAQRLDHDIHALQRRLDILVDERVATHFLELRMREADAGGRSRERVHLLGHFRPEQLELARHADSEARG
jgi:hypothetical protein